MFILENSRGLAAFLALVMAVVAPPIRAEDAGGTRVGDGTGAIMTFDDLDEVAPHLEKSRTARAVPSVVAEAAVEPGRYYYYDEAGNLVPYTDGRDLPTTAGVYSHRDYGPAISSEQVRVYPGPGQIVVLSEHDSWPAYEGAGSTGYWDRGHTITGDPAYMSYYERNYGWGLGSSWYAGPRFDRGHVPSHMRVPRADRAAGTNFQDRFPGRLPARRDSADPMERREARREFLRNNATPGASGRTPGVPRSRPPGIEGRRSGR